MKKLFTVITFLFLCLPLYADKLANDPYTEARFLQLQQLQQPLQTTSSMSDMLVNLFLEQGIMGAMLLILGIYFYKTESLARTDRINLQTKLEGLVERSQDNLVEVKTHLSSLDARMQNVEREIESTKDFIFTKLKG